MMIEIITVIPVLVQDADKNSRKSDIQAPSTSDSNHLFSSVKKFFPRAPRDTEVFHNKIARSIARLI